MPKTDAFPYALSFKNEEDYIAIMETVQPLILQRVFSGPVQMGDGVHEVLTGHNNDRAKLWSGEGAMPREILYKWMDEHSPFGRCSWVIYGMLPQLHDGGTWKANTNSFTQGLNMVRRRPLMPLWP